MTDIWLGGCDVVGAIVGWKPLYCCGSCHEDAELYPEDYPMGEVYCFWRHDRQNFYVSICCALSEEFEGTPQQWGRLLLRDDNGT